MPRRCDFGLVVMFVTLILLNGSGWGQPALQKPSAGAKSAAKSTPSVSTGSGTDSKGGAIQLKSLSAKSPAVQNPKPKVQNREPSAPASAGWKWIWAADGTMPPETLYFRHGFALARPPRSARLIITADDSYQAYVNGSKNAIAEANDWTTVREYDVTRLLKAGDNVLAISCRNTAGPGGLIYKLIVKTATGRMLTLVSDARVRFTRNPPLAWNAVTLDDKNWKAAKEMAPAGGPPWGPLRGAPTPDYTRLIRLWDIRAGGSPNENPYTRQRAVGDRMILSSSVSSQSDMQIMNNMGFTLFQTDSDHLSTEELKPGKWDFHNADASRQAVQKLGLDWCYFPHEAFPPAWYRLGTPFTRIQCLEHGQPVEAFSPWDSRWPGFIESGYDAIAKEFGSPKSKIQNPKSVQALYVGVHGDYGEAGLLTGARISVPGQKEDWQRRFGDLHDHLGFWCADPAARQDFRVEMLKKYETLSALNAAWNRHFQTPEEIVYPPIPKGEPAVEERRMWLDFVAWYQGGVGRAIELNLRAARTRFPDTLLMLPAGFGDENVRGGNDNSLIPKLAAKYKANVRSTHGHYKPFAENAVSMLGRLGSASRFYGAPFWTEPPGALTANEEVERIFEAVSQGSVGYFDWASNAVTNRDVYYRYGKYLRVEKPIVDVAMFYPAEAQHLRVDQPYASTFARATAYLRDFGNFDIVDDRMVRDGCLAQYRVLALWEGTLADASTLEKIKQWVNEGGVLLAYDFGKVRTFEGDTTWFQDLFGYYNELAPARVTERYVGNMPPQYRLPVGKIEYADYLGDAWYDPETVGETTAGVTARWTGEKATVRLPIAPDRRYTLIVRAYLPPEAEGMKHQVFLSGRRDLVKIGDLSATGDVTYRFPVPEGLLAGRSLVTLTIQSDTLPEAKVFPNSAKTRALGVRVQSIQVIEQGTTEDADALPPPGRLARELDLRYLNPNFEKSEQSWARLYGKGLTIYFPANKSLLKGYIEVVHQAMNHLSQIDPSRRDALPIDDTADGVYATLFSDKILFYNPKDTPVTKTVKIPAEAFAAWKEQVATPTENAWSLKMEPHSISAIYLSPPAQELLYECEDFKGLGALKPSASPDCSPGTGLSCVRMPGGAAIVTKFKVEVPGRYKLFTRCTRNGKLEPVEILLDGQAIGTPGERTEAGQTLLVGSVNLTKDTHTLVLKARDKRDIRADFVLLSNDPTIAGYDFATRTVPVE
jgi:hypothetical protein